MPTDADIDLHYRTWPTGLKCDDGGPEWGDRAVWVELHHKGPHRFWLDWGGRSVETHILFNKPASEMRVGGSLADDAFRDYGVRVRFVHFGKHGERARKRAPVYKRVLGSTSKRVRARANVWPSFIPGGCSGHQLVPRLRIASWWSRACGPPPSASALPRVTPARRSITAIYRRLRSSVDLRGPSRGGVMPLPRPYFHDWERRRVGGGPRPMRPVGQTRLSPRLCRNRGPPDSGPRGGRGVRIVNPRASAGRSPRTRAANLENRILRSRDRRRQTKRNRNLTHMSERQFH